MYFVGKIDRDIYSVVTPDIKTDEVVITEERIEHIKTHHPKDFERFFPYLSEIVLDPDYILRSDWPNTAFVLKEVQSAGERFELILRLRVGGDPEDYKNSILTFLRIKEKKWNKYLRNKNILYKKR